MGQVWALHLGLAFAFPLITSAILYAMTRPNPSFLAYAIPLLASVVVYVGAPFVGYVWLLFGDTPPVSDTEPCVRSGSVLGAHWFEFNSLPGSRAWTRDQARADAIRARPQILRLREGLTTAVVPRPEARSNQHLMAATQTSSMVFVAMLLGYLWSGFVLFVATVGAGESFFRAVKVTLDNIGMGMFIFVPVLLLTGVGLATSFLSGWMAWNLVLAPRRASKIELGAHQLRDRDRSIDLDDPDLSIELTYDAYGARLALRNPRQALVLFGDHADLAPLSALLHTRDHSAPGDRERIQAALQRLRES